MLGRNMMALGALRTWEFQAEAIGQAYGSAVDGLDATFAVYGTVSKRASCWRDKRPGKTMWSKAIRAGQGLVTFRIHVSCGLSVKLANTQIRQSCTAGSITSP